MTLTQITEKGIKDGEIVNADINASAAIAKSKLASLDIVNGDINASAAIAKSKLASLDIVNGDISASAAIAKSKIETFVNTNADNRVITGSGTENTLNGESQLLFDGNLTIKAADGGNRYYFGGSDIYHAELSLYDNTDAQKVRLYAGGVTFFNGGDVGIGTTSPNQKLHVSGGGINLDSGWNTQWGGNTDRAFIQGNSGSSGSVLIGTNNDTKLTIQGTGQINHNGPLIFTKNNQVNPYDSSLQANDGAISIRGDLGTGNYWGWRQRYTEDGSVSTSNKTKVLPSINDFQYPNDSDGLLIASTNKIGFAASAESPLYANGVQMIFDSNGLALGSGNAFDCTHGSTTSANANVVIRTNGNIVLKSGAGIDFSATANSSGSNQDELLDDYEAGNWVPTFPNNGTGNQALGTYLAEYVKVGRFVYAFMYANITGAPQNANSTWVIGGLPFATNYSNLYHHGTGNVTYVGGNSYSQWRPLVTINSTCYFHRTDGSNAVLKNSDVVSEGMGYWIMGLNYMTSA